MLGGIGMKHGLRVCGAIGMFVALIAAGLYAAPSASAAITWNVSNCSVDTCVKANRTGWTAIVLHATGAEVKVAAHSKDTGFIDIWTYDPKGHKAINYSVHATLDNSTGGSIAAKWVGVRSGQYVVVPDRTLVCENWYSSTHGFWFGQVCQMMLYGSVI
jgi:hypothetical protein